METRRKIELKYLEHQDFWAFYMANKEDVDYIIEASCRMFQRIVPSEDMKTEILLELYRSGFLDRYDSTKARLNTYITSLVRAHAKTVAEREVPGSVRKDVTPRQQVLDSEFNEGTTESLYLTAPEEEEGVAEMDRRYLNKLKDRIESTSRRVLDMLLKDQTSQEISDALGCTKPCTSWYCRKLIIALRRLAKKELRLRRELSKVRRPAVALNRHKKAKTRNLTEDEKALIRNEFLKLNGIFLESKKDASRIKAMLPADVTVFQVSGEIFKLHRLVKEDKLRVDNRAAYFAALNKRRRRWATYKSERYRKLRDRIYRPQITGVV